MRCPHCAKEFDPREAIAEAEWREIILLWPKLGPHSRLAMEYCELFGVSYTKPKKLLRLLKDMAELLEKKSFKFDRRVYSVSDEVITDALRAMCNRRFDRPLSNHSYLYQVMITESQKEIAKHEQYLRAREKGAPREEEVRGQRSEVSEEGPRETIEEFKRRKGVNSLVDLIGKKME